jgi:hypothetical protein
MQKLRDEFMAFQEQCIWFQCCYNIYTDLYESGDNRLELLNKVAGHFFRDLNEIIIDYILLQIAKITDPAKDCRDNYNLTIKYINKKLTAANLMTDEIKNYSDRMQAYSDKYIKDARRKIIAHADKNTFMLGTALGGHTKEEQYDFIHALQKYNDAVSNAIGVEPNDYLNSGRGSGDVIDLLRKIDINGKPRRLR